MVTPVEVLGLLDGWFQIFRARPPALGGGAGWREKGLTAARAGYQHSAGSLSWQSQLEEALTYRIGGELSQAELSWYESGAEAVMVYSCFCLGCGWGLAARGVLQTADLMLMEALLAEHIVTKCAAIEDAYNS